MRVLVTGGDGFIGSHLVRDLVADGLQVRLLDLPARRRPAFPAAGVEIVRCDLRRDTGLVAALAGVDEVFHLAGLTRSLSRRDMLDTNAGGTRRLAAAALAAGLPGRFVLCSSLSAVGPSGDGTPLAESAPCRPMTWYGESKVEAERALLDLEGDLAVTVVRPPAVYGPGDRDFLGLFRAVARGLAPQMAPPSARYSLVYVEDLVRAFRAAAASEATRGRIYFAAHPEIVTGAGTLDAAEKALGRRARRFRLPGSLLRLGGRTADLVSQVTGRASILGSQRLRELMAAHWVCTPGALERDAGWTAEVGLEEGFERTVGWYRGAGKL